MKKKKVLLLGHLSLSLIKLPARTLAFGFGNQDEGKTMKISI